MRRSAPTLGVLIVLAIVAAQALLLPLFAGLASDVEPRHLPIAVAGPRPLADPLVARLRAERPRRLPVRRDPGRLRGRRPLPGQALAGPGVSRPGTPPASEA